jgi:hypothetical protein
MKRIDDRCKAVVAICRPTKGLLVSASSPEEELRPFRDDDDGFGLCTLFLFRYHLVARN